MTKEQYWCELTKKRDKEDSQGYSIHEKARNTKTFVQIRHDMRKTMEDLGEEYIEIEPEKIRKDCYKR